jgi:hypothetical protein
MNARIALGTLLTTLMVISQTPANWVYLLPQSGRTQIQVIFADDLNPDPRVPIEKICKGKTKLFALKDDTKPLEIKEVDWQMDPKEQAFTFKVPEGTRAVAGTTQMGFFKVHGTEIRSRLTYYPKVLIEPVKESQKPCCSAVVPFEIVPLVKEGKLHFQAIWQGKPVDKAFEDKVVGRSVFAIFPPDGKKMAMPVKVGENATTANGLGKPGRYAVWAVYTIDKPGVVDGKAYDEERYYATLVVDFEPLK